MGRKLFPQTVKQAIVQKALSPNAPSLKDLANEYEIHSVTLSRWIKEYAMGGSMKKTNQTVKTPDEKLKIIIETASLSENELGQYLRKNGLHSNDIEEWKTECISGLKPSVGRPKKDAEVFELRKDKKELQKELRRKDRALAEMSARVILLKKRNLIFGVDEDDE